MDRAAVAVVRVFLAAWGLLWIGTAFACLILPGVMYSGAAHRRSPLSPPLDLLINSLMLGGGSFLLMPPRWLAAVRPLLALLLTTALALTVWSAWRAIEIMDLLGLVSALGFVAVPIALQCFFVADARRTLQNPPVQ